MPTVFLLKILKKKLFNFQTKIFNNASVLRLHVSVDPDLSDFATVQHRPQQLDVGVLEKYLPVDLVSLFCRRYKEISFWIPGQQINAFVPRKFLLTLSLQNIEIGIFLLNRVVVYPLGFMTLLRADCRTPIQLLVRSECYLYSYHSAVVIIHNVCHPPAICLIKYNTNISLKIKLTR